MAKSLYSMKMGKLFPVIDSPYIINTIKKLWIYVRNTTNKKKRKEIFKELSSEDNIDITFFVPCLNEEGEYCWNNRNH